MAMPDPGYSRQTIDAKFEALRHEFRADLKEECGALRAELKQECGALRAEIREVEGKLRVEIREVEGKLRVEMATGFGNLSAQITGLRGEMKIWLIVMSAVFAVLSSGIGNRLLNQVWPPGPGPAGAASTR